MCGVVRFGYSHGREYPAWARLADSVVCSAGHYARSGYDTDGTFLRGVSKTTYDLGALRYNNGDYEAAVLPLSRACAVAEWRCVGGPQVYPPGCLQTFEWFSGQRSCCRSPVSWNIVQYMKRQECVGDHITCVCVRVLVDKFLVNGNWASDAQTP